MNVCEPDKPVARILVKMGSERICLLVVLCHAARQGSSNCSDEPCQRGTSPCAFGLSDCILSGDRGELSEEDDLPLHKYPPGMRTERRELPFQFGALLSFMVLMTCFMIFMHTKKQEATARAKCVKVT